MVNHAFGYDFARGRQDLSTHPFTTSFGIGDVRITTRVNIEPVRGDDGQVRCSRGPGHPVTLTIVVGSARHAPRGRMTRPRRRTPESSP